MIVQVLLVLPILWIVMAALGPPTKWEQAELTLMERIVFRTALGLGIFSYAIFALGMIGALNRTSLGILLGVFFLAALPGSVAIGRDLFQRRNVQGDKAFEQKAEPLFSYLQLFMGAGIVAAVVVMVIGAASPPTGLDWDGLSYHLADPRLFLMAGRIYPLEWEHHSNFPFLVQMLYTFGLAFDTVALAKAFHLAMGLLAALAIAAFCGWVNRDTTLEGRGLSPVLPVAIFLGAPVVLWEATVAYVDLGAALYTFLAVYAFTVATRPLREEVNRPLGEEGNRKGWWLLSGVMMGFAIGAKTTNGIFLILLLVWWAWDAATSRRGRGAATASLAAFILPAALLAAPWFIKSYLWTGNPVYPFLYRVFGGRNWNEELSRIYEMEQAQFGMGRSLPDLLLLPWNLTFHPIAFANGGLYLTSSIGPYALALLPLLVIARPLPRWSRSWLLLTLGFLAIWIMLTQQIRYMLPLLPVLALLGAWGGEKARIGTMGRAGVALFTGAMLWLTVFRGFAYAQPMIPVALGMETQEAYLNRTFQLAPAVRFVNEELPEDAKLLLIDETRGFYFDREYIWGNPGHHTLIPWDSFRSPEEMASGLRERGFTHFLLNTQFMRPNWGESRWEALIQRGIETGLLGKVFEERGVAIFEISTAPPR